MLRQVYLSWKWLFPYLPNLIWVVFPSKCCEISGSAGIIERQVEKKKIYFCNSWASFPTIYWNKMSCMHMYNWSQMCDKVARDILSRNNSNFFRCALFPSTWPPEQKFSPEWNVFILLGTCCCVSCLSARRGWKVWCNRGICCNWTCSLCTFMFLQFWFLL